MKINKPFAFNSIRKEIEEEVEGGFDYENWANGSRNRGPRKINPDMLESVKRLFQEGFGKEEGK